MVNIEYAGHLEKIINMLTLGLLASSEYVESESRTYSLFGLIIFYIFATFIRRRDSDKGLKSGVIPLPIFMISFHLVSDFPCIIR